jgi:hypothetical protein
MKKPHEGHRVVSEEEVREIEREVAGGGVTDALKGGELAALCYQHGWTDAARLHRWLSIILAATGGDPAFRRLHLLPLQACERGTLVRVPGGPSRVWTAVSPQSGILSAGQDRLQLNPAERVVVGVHVGLAALWLPADLIGTASELDLLRPAASLRDARLLQARHRWEPWGRGAGALEVTVTRAHRDAAVVALSSWLYALEDAA